MSNPQLKEFDGRLRRIAEIQRRGGGFEAVGTLGQSHYTRLRLSNVRRPILRPVVVFLTVILVFKGFLLASMGQETYEQTVGNLAGGSIVEQAGALIMTNDPVTMTIAEIVAPLFG